METIGVKKKTAKGGELDNLGLLRAFAITIVVLRHCFSPYTGAWPISKHYSYHQITDLVGNYISTISMPLFVFISGLLFSYLRNTLGKYPTYPILLKKKFNRLLKPYILLAPFYILLILQITDVNTFFFEFFSGTGHLWFLLMIFNVFVIFYPLEKFFNRKPLLGFLLATLFFLSYPLFSRLGLIPLSKTFQYGVFFYVGYFFFTFNDFIIKKVKGKLLMFFLLHLILFFIATYSVESLESLRIQALLKGYSKLPLGLLSITFVYLFFSDLGKKGYLKNNSFIDVINNNSYYIYLIHQPILKVLFRWEPLKHLPSAYVIFLTFTISFTLSFAIGQLSMKSKLGRKLVGAK